MPGTAHEWDELRACMADTGATLRDRRLPRFVDEEPKHDEVAHPAHYNTGEIECIEAIKASMSSEEFWGYLKGNTLKYLWRYNYKGKPKQDLEKAQWYLNRLIEQM